MPGFLIERLGVFASCSLYYIPIAGVNVLRGRKRVRACWQESAVFLIGPEMQSSTGKILDGLLCSTGGVIWKLKMVSLGRW